MTHVMVADDEVPIRQWLEFCINKLEEYKVVGSAANGAKGYSLFRKTMPEIVITDIRMPVMDGLEMMKMIQHINPAAEVVVLTSHEDFEYARSAMKLGALEYILKTEITEESLKAVLDRARTELAGAASGSLEKTEEEVSNRNHYLRSLVLSRHAGIVTEKMLEEYDIALEHGSYAVLDVMTKEESPSRIVLPEGAFVHTLKVPLDLNHTMLVGNLNKNCSPSLAKQQTLIEQCCRELLNQIPCSIGCSDIYDNPSRLGEAMRQAHDRVKLSFYEPERQIFTNQPMGKRRLENGEKYKLRFSKELINQNFKKALEIRNQMMEEVRRERVTNIDSICKLYQFFLTSIYHITRDDAERVEEQLTDLGACIQNAESLNALDEILKREFESCGAFAMGNAEYSASIRSAIRYMEEHYAESLQLADVAAYVGLSAEYLSRLFKDETGIKFVVYLNNLRLKHALRLLETTNLKVYEIAEQVGYSNLSYFSTVFKKNFGQNPFDYKNTFARQTAEEGQKGGRSHL